MGNSLPAPSTTTTIKEWLLPNNHVLKVTHDLKAHYYSMGIDGMELSKGPVTLFHEPMEVEFRVDESTGVLRMAKEGPGRFGYQLLIDGERVSAAVNGKHPTQAYASPFRRRSDSEEMEDLYDVAVTCGRLKTGRTGEKRVVYEIETVKSIQRRGDTSRVSTSYHSYREFHELHKSIMSTFKLLCPEYIPSLPHLPQWYPKFLVDHTSEEFIERRRGALQNYLKDLLKLKVVILNSDVLNFLAVKSVGLSLSNLDLFAESRTRSRMKQFGSAGSTLRTSSTVRSGEVKKVSKSVTADYPSKFGCKVDAPDESTATFVASLGHTTASTSKKGSALSILKGEAAIPLDTPSPMAKDGASLARSYSDGFMESYGMMV